METITLGQIAGGVALVSGLITGITLLIRNFKKWIAATLTEKFNAIDVRLDELGGRIDELSMDNAKNFLVTTIGNIESGRNIDNTELQRFWETYDFYIMHGGNSYIREKVHKLKERELL